MASALQYIGMLLFPFVIMELVKRNKIAGILGPVALSYIFGFLYAQILPLPFSKEVSENLINFSVPTAIALLLFSTDFMAWLKYARKAILSFSLLVISVILCTSIVFVIFKDSHPEAWKLSGMFTGVYIGGTPNLIAIGYMLDAKPETITTAQACDVFNSGIYLLLLLTVAQRLLLQFLPSFVPLPDNPRDETFHYGRLGLELSNFQLAGKLALSFLLALAVFIAAIGVSMLTTKKLSIIPIILSVSVFSLALSFFPKVRFMPKTYEFGEYFICIFCLGLGSLTRFDNIISDNIAIFEINSAIMWGSIALHLLLVSLFKIDADTALITSTAGIFGPHFIGPVATVLKNKQVVVSGITTGLVGFAIANFVGLGLSYVLRYFFLNI